MRIGLSLCAKIRMVVGWCMGGRFEFVCENPYK